MRRAVIYYSLSDNTKEAAEFIANELNAEIYRIDLVKPMPKSMFCQMMFGGMQASFSVKPKISGVPKDIEAFDDIIIGTPIWAGKNASPINTLLYKYKICDKVRSVFTYSGGGDNAKCIENFNKSLKNLKNNVALADRNNKLASENDTKLRAFVEAIR